MSKKKKQSRQRRNLRSVAFYDGTHQIIDKLRKKEKRSYNGMIEYMIETHPMFLEEAAK